MMNQNSLDPDECVRRGVDPLILNSESLSGIRHGPGNGLGEGIRLT